MSDHDPYQDLVDESRHREALDARARERWLRTQLEESAHFVGTLADLAEQQVPVTVRTESGATHRGRLVGVATDHVALRSADGEVTYLALGAVTDLRPRPGPDRAAGAGDLAVATGERGGAVDRTLGEVLLDAVADRARVRLRVRGHVDAVSGRLAGVGRDVVSVHLDGGGDVAYLRLDAVTEATLTT